MNHENSRGPKRTRASKCLRKAAARKGMSSVASTTPAPSKPPCIARNTPLENTGSMNAYASPSIRKRSPLLMLLLYE